MKFTAIRGAMCKAQRPLKKSFLIMKIVILLLTIGFLQVNAKSYGQISLNERHATLEIVLQKIKKQTNYNFIYDEKQLHINDITVSVNNVPIEKALDACFKELPVTYSIVKNNIILKHVTPSIIDKIKAFLSGPVHLTGKITDSTGAPLARATVFFVKRNTAKATVANTGADYTIASYITNENGLFYFDAEDGDVIGVSYVGYQTYQFTVRKDMPFQNIVLHRADARLNEVIVNTGYQKLSKDRATGSFGKPDMQIFSEPVRMTLSAGSTVWFPGLPFWQDQAMFLPTETEIIPRRSKALFGGQPACRYCLTHIMWSTVFMQMT